MNIKCPFCGGPANRMWFSHLEKKHPHIYAIFVVECWSGNLQKTSKHPLFQARIRLLRKVEVDQVQELENRILELEAKPDVEEGDGS